MPNLHQIVSRIFAPRSLRTILKYLIPCALILFSVGLVVGLSKALLFSPPDYQQGDSVRIMYVHVPAAYIGTLGYAALALFSAIFLIWKLPTAQMCAESIAPIGAVFTLLCLVTGSIWGKPMWGTWWVWDARLTSVLVLFFLYLGYLAVLGAFQRRADGRRPAAILAIIGVINLPIIKFSVDWWNTLHQPASLLRADGSALAPEMLTPLPWMMLAYTALFVLLSAMRLETALIEKQLQSASAKR